MRRPTAHVAVTAACCAAIVGCGSRQTPERASASAHVTSFPRPADVGVPAGWVPRRTLTSDLVVTKAGSVVQDVLLKNADLVVDAPDVTIRRVKLQGGRIQNMPGANCRNGMVVEDSTISPPPGESTSGESEGALGVGGYTARRVKLWRRSEGFRVGGRSAGCGPVHIEDAFVKIVLPRDRCADHADGLQGYDAPPLRVVNVTIDFTDAACGTAPFFVPDGQGNTTADVKGLLVMGGGYPFRLGIPGSVSGLKIVDRSWAYAPVDVRCSLLKAWSAQIVRITRDYRISRTVHTQPCR